MPKLHLYNKIQYLYILQRLEEIGVMKQSKRLVAKLLCIVMAIPLIAVNIPGKAEAAWIPDHNIPAYQQKDIFETETVTIEGISVEEIIGDTVTPIEKQIKFHIYNSTKQELEQTVISEDGKLPELELIKNHNYIFFAEDSDYEMKNVYVWVRGEHLVDIKNYTSETEYDYPEVKSLQLNKRASSEQIPENDRRVFVNIPVLTSGGGSLFNVKVKLVSDVETLETTTGSSGKIRLDLLEDTNYMVVVENDSYDVDSFPISVKDKSEYGAGKYPYDHSSCVRVDDIRLTEKKDVHKNDTVLTNTDYGEIYKDIYDNIEGNTTITGLNFKDFLVLDQKADTIHIQELENKDYDVIDIKVVNPHRWEVAKLAAGEYHITEQIDGYKQIEHVYYIDRENNLSEIPFEQSEDYVTFTMNSLSLYPVVFEYKETEVDEAREALKQIIEDAQANINTLKKEEYTEESWMTYLDAVLTSRELLQKENVTKNMYLNAIQNIKDAEGGLTKKPIEIDKRELPFKDVTDQDWFFPYIDYVYENGIMKGLNDISFGPNDTLARAQFAVILYRMNDMPKIEYQMIFPDVEAGLWYTDAILWAASTKVVTGYSDTGKFGPSDDINREQIAVMMYRYAGYKGYPTDNMTDFASFTDADQVNVFAKDAVEWAVANGIITGKNNGTVLDPQGNATRAECAAIIQRFLDKYGNETRMQ